jgi:hypothetical protein
MMVVVEKMVAHYEGMAVNKEAPVKVVENEEPRKEEPGPKEWKGDPCIQVTIIRRWRIVAVYRRSFIVIIVSDNGWVCVLRSRRGRTFGVSAWTLCDHWYFKFERSRPECL